MKLMMEEIKGYSIDFDDYGYEIDDNRRAFKEIDHDADIGDIVVITSNAASEVEPAYGYIYTSDTKISDIINNLRDDYASLSVVPFIIMRKAEINTYENIKNNLLGGKVFAETLDFKLNKGKRSDEELLEMEYKRKLNKAINIIKDYIDNYYGLIKSWRKDLKWPLAHLKNRVYLKNFLESNYLDMINYVDYWLENGEGLEDVDEDAYDELSHGFIFNFIDEYIKNEHLQELVGRLED